MEEFTPEQQQMYDALDPVDQQQVDAAGDEGKIIVLMVLYQSTLRRSGSPTNQSSTATTNQQPSTTIVFDPDSKGGGTPVDLTNTYYQQALGVTGGRRVSVTGQVVPETYTGFRGTTSPMQELRGEIRTPIYFEGDQDKIALFGKEEIASIQSQMKKAGVLGSTYRIGVADEATITAFTKVLGQANRNLSSWQTALGNLQANPPPSKGLQYRVSNPDDINKIIEQTSQRVLGRAVDDATRQRLIKTYQQLQIDEQRQAAGGASMVVQAPDVSTFTEKKLQKMAGPEADAYKFADFASSLLGR
jgi:hypothetical protein